MNPESIWEVRKVHLCQEGKNLLPEMKKFAWGHVEIHQPRSKPHVLLASILTPSDNPPTTLARHWSHHSFVHYSGQSLATQSVPVRMPGMGNPDAQEEHHCQDCVRTPTHNSMMGVRIGMWVVYTWDPGGGSHSGEVCTYHLVWILFPTS